MTRPYAARAAWAVAIAGAVGLPAPLGAGCSGGLSATYDSYPIALGRAPMGGGVAGDGALLARGADSEAPGTPLEMLVDSGSSITAEAGPVTAGVSAFMGGFDLHDYVSPDSPDSPLRATFRGLELLRLPLQPVGDGTVTPLGVVGGNLLRNFSVGMRFGAACTVAGAPARCASMTLWSHQGADESFLEDAGFAVYRFTPYGGGEVTVQGSPDFVGVSGPIVLPPTRVVLRTCAVPEAFDPAAATLPLSPPSCCTSNDATAFGASATDLSPIAGDAPAKGVNLALLFATGVGPVILSQSAFARVQAAVAGTALPAIPDPIAQPGSLFVATWSSAIDAGWSTIPRLAFVDLEADPTADPGACVELGRARRTEQVSYLTVTAPTSDTCGQPCDADPHEPDLAQSSAAYLELGGQIPVAVVGDDEPFLQALRFDVRPEGPELDGLVGAGALVRSRVEVDFLSSQPRALFSCEPEAPRDECWAGPRCPRLPDGTSVHYCFHLPAHRLAPHCAQATCTSLPTP